MTNDDFREALKSAEELEITVVGRKTGKKFSALVWFVNEGEKLYLLPATGTDSSWYKNVLKSPTIELQASGKKATVKAMPIKDKKQSEEIIDKFNAKYGAGEVNRWYPRLDAAIELTL